MVAPPKQGQLVHVRIPAEDLAWLDQAAAARGVSRAELIRLLITAQRTQSVRRPPQMISTAKAESRPGAAPQVAHPPHLFKGQPSRPLHCETCGIPKGQHP